MNNIEVMEALCGVYNLIYADTKSIQTGLYSEERIELEKEIEKIRDSCNHTFDANGNSAIEGEYCTICGKKVK